MAVHRLVGVSSGAAVIATLALVVGGVGVAAAANGGSLTLGHANEASSTTMLSNPNGTPLSLKSGHDQAPLKVDSSTQVGHLNASLVGGSSAAALKTSGSSAFTTYAAGKDDYADTSATPMVTTAKLPAGTYYVTASVLGETFSTGDVFCAIRTGTDTPEFYPLPQGGTSVVGYSTIAIDATVTVTAGQRISDYCWSATTTAEVSYAAIDATKVDTTKLGTAPRGVTPAIPRAPAQ